MSRWEYEIRKEQLAIQFLREKEAGLIPRGKEWAQWCWERGIYPLTEWEWRLLTRH